MNSKLILGSVAFLLSSSATAVLAQTIEQAAPAAISADDETEIVVTAQRRQQRLQDVPVAVSVVSGASLQNANIAGLADLSARLPAVRIAPAPGADLLNIRGIGSGLNPGLEQSVGTFVDGAYRGRSRAMRAALFDIDRVEVLKGPQTTFFGNNTIAGALNITTRKASDDFAGNASLLYSPATHEYAAELGVSGPISDTLSGRVAAKFSGMDGFSRNSALKRTEPHKRDFVGRVSLKWNPSADWETNLRVEGVRDRDRGAFFSELVDCPPNPAIGQPAGACLRYLNANGGSVEDSLNNRSDNPLSTVNNYDMVEAVLGNRLRLGDFTVSALTSYFTHDVYFLTNLIPISVPGVGGGALAPNASVEDYRQFSQELRLESPTGDTFEYMTGLYFAADKLEAGSVFGQYFANVGAAGAPIYNANTPIANRLFLNQKTRQISAFASGTAKLSDQLKVSAGLRYSRVHKEAVRGNLYGTAGLVPSVGNFVAGPESIQLTYSRLFAGELGNYPSPERTDDKLMPSANIQYNFTPNTMIYASYTNGFKAGGYSMATALSEFGPETVDSFEIGLKGQIGGSLLTYGISLFNSDYKGLQESTNIVLASGSVVSLVRNVARARSRGVDANLSLRATRTLSFFADASYLDAKYRSYPNAPCATIQSAQQGARCLQDLSGRRRAFAPQFSGNAGLRYRNSLTDSLEIGFEPSVYFSSRYYQSATSDQLLMQPKYAKLDARLSLGRSDGGWELAIIGKNLTDKMTASFRNSVPTATGSIYALPDMPRNVAFQFTAKF